MARRPHRIYARVYPQVAAALEQRGLGEQRERLLSGLSGKVLEIGCGDGANFPHYPADVTELVAVEPEPRLRRLARERLTRMSLRATVFEGTAESLPLRDEDFDAVVSTLVLCSVDDQRRALAEIARVLKPGGRLVCFEHVGSSHRVIRLGEQVFDAVFWSHVFGGCHTARDTGAAIEAAGFDTTELERDGYEDQPWPLSMSPHLIGTARKPA